jgi:hypothetical protein
LWRRCGIVIGLLAASCSSDDPVTGGGKRTAGPVAQLYGIGSYELTETGGSRELALFGLQGEALGTTTVESDLSGDLSLTFKPSGGGRGGTIKATFTVDDPAEPVELVLDLKVDGASGGKPITLRVRVRGSHDPMGVDMPPGTWNTGLVLEAPLDGLTAPGIGGIRLTEDGVWAVLQTVDGGESAASITDLRIWLEHVGVGGLLTTNVDELLLGVLFDLDNALNQLIPSQGQALSIKRSALTEDDTCAERLGSDYTAKELDGIRRYCTREDYVGFCITEEQVCKRWGPGLGGKQICWDEEYESNLVHAFTSEGCLWGHLECAVNALRRGYCDALPTQAELDQYRADCGRTMICPGGLRGTVTSNMGEGCACLCTEASCAEHCKTVAARESLSVSAPQCLDKLTCDCGFEPGAMCGLTFPTSYCGEAQLDLDAGAVYCTTSTCNDGAFTAVCSANPTQVEVCDASTPDGLTCASGEECVDCACAPCDTSVQCGDGRVSWTCPGLEEECDGEGQAQCPDGHKCELCGCVKDEPTCQDADFPWSPAGETCGVPCPITMQTPEGTWNDCVGANSRPGCSQEVPAPIVGDKGHMIQSCRVWSPTYDPKNFTGPETTWENTVTLNAHWFDLGRDRPTVSFADFQAAVLKVSNYDIEKYGAQSVLLYSSTHWAAVSCQSPLSFGSSFPDAEAKAMLKQIEALSWAR